MAETVSVSSDEILNCPICLEKYKTPRALPCLHTFCEECLDTFIQSQKQEGSAFPCPVCRSSTTLPDAKLKVEKWARSFPLNHMVVSLMDTEIRQVSDKTLCESCRNNKKEVPAVFWCQECSQGMCNVCHGYHKCFPALSSHKTIPIEEAASQGCKTKAQLDLVDEGCPRHRGKSLEVFCEDHRELCCLVCFVRGHRDCKTIRDIDEISEEQQNENSADEFLKDLNEVKAKMEDVIQVKYTQAEKIDCESSHLVKEMENMVTDAVQVLNKMLSSYRDEVSNVHTETRKTIIETRTRVQEFVANVANCSKMVKRASQIGSPRQRFVTFEKLRSQIISHYQQLKSELDKDEEMTLTSTIDGTLENISKMLSIGALIVSKKPSSAVRDVSCVVEGIINRTLKLAVAKEKGDLQTPVRDLMTASVSLVKVVTKKEIGSNWLTGGIFLKNGRLLLADCTNSQLLELDEQWSVVKVHKVDGRPAVISQQDENERIYLSFSGKKLIAIYDVKLDLILVRQITLQWLYWGLDFSDDMIIASRNEALDFYSYDGNLFRSKPKSKDNGYVSVSKSQSIIHGDGDNVVFRKMNGTKWFTYTDIMLRGVRGIAVDNQENVYACGMNSDNIHQISANGEQKRILLNKLHAIKKPYCIVFNKQKNIFIVTPCVNNEIAFEVYSFDDET